MKTRTDFRVVPNNQTNRSDLWDVVSGGARLYTTNSRANAEEIACKLNMDPWYFDRGQTRFERNGAIPSVDRGF
jgi:hypothetical protein